MIVRFISPLLVCFFLTSFLLNANADDDESEWKDTEVTTQLWQKIRDRDTHSLYQMIQQQRDVIHLRSADGRGPLFWAYEFGHDEAIKLLLELGVDSEMKDANGVKPSEMERVVPESVEDDDEYYEDEDYEDEDY